MHIESFDCCDAILEARSLPQSMRKQYLSYCRIGLGSYCRNLNNIIL